MRSIGSDGCPLVFALTDSRGIQVSVWIGAEADAVGAHLGVGRILATTNTRRWIHLSVVVVLTITKTVCLVDNCVGEVFAFANTVGVHRGMGGVYA